jgi:hypothetical protein
VWICDTVQIAYRRPLEWTPRNQRVSVGSAVGRRKPCPSGGAVCKGLPLWRLSLQRLTLCPRGVIALTASWNHRKFVGWRESMQVICRKAHRTYLRLVDSGIRSSFLSGYGVGFSTVCGCTLPFHVDCFSRSGRLLRSCQIQPECVSTTLKTMRELAVPGTPEIPDGFVTRELFGTSRSFREARWGCLLVRVQSWF